MVEAVIHVFHDSFLPSILASAVCLGFYDIEKKQSVQNNSVMPVLFFATLSGTLFFALTQLLCGNMAEFAPQNTRFFLLVVLKSCIVSASWICVYYAMRDLPITIASPIRASSPLWTFFGGLIFFAEIPSLLQGIAMLAIFAGYYVFSVLGKLEGIRFTHNRGIFLIFAGTILGSVSALYDKYLLGVAHVPRNFMQFWFSVDLVFILGLAWLIRTAFGHKHRFEWRWSIPLTGIILIVADWLYFYSLGLPDTRISIISLVRRCGVVVTFFAGSFWFHDANMKKKAVALALILLGVILLALAAR